MKVTFHTNLFYSIGQGMWTVTAAMALTESEADAKLLCSHDRGLEWPRYNVLCTLAADR